jgi:uncharacterized protein YukE
LTEISDGLQTELDVWRLEMDALFGTGWQGEAATGFAQGWQQWQTGVADVLNGLRDMAALLKPRARTAPRPTIPRRRVCAMPG